MSQSEAMEIRGLDAVRKIKGSEKRLEIVEKFVKLCDIEDKNRESQNHSSGNISIKFLSSSKRAQTFHTNFTSHTGLHL